MGTHMKVLSESYPMNNNMTGFSKKSLHHCALTKEASTLEGLTYAILCSRPDPQPTSLPEHHFSPNPKIATFIYTISVIQDGIVSSLSWSVNDGGRNHGSWSHHVIRNNSIPAIGNKWEYVFVTFSASLRHIVDQQWDGQGVLSCTTWNPISQCHSNSKRKLLNFKDIFKCFTWPRW